MNYELDLFYKNEVIEYTNKNIMNEGFSYDSFFDNNMLKEYLLSDHYNINDFLNEVNRNATGLQRKDWYRKIRLGVKNFIHNLRMKFRKLIGKLKGEYKWRTLNAKTPEQKEQAKEWYKKKAEQAKTNFNKAQDKANKKAA